MNDSSSGMRKLAKMVDACYPSNEQSAYPPDSLRVPVGMGGLLKRVMGRGNKNKTRGVNEDTYDLVTPFVPDDY